MGCGALPQSPPDRLRQARRGARSGGPGGDLRGRDRRDPGQRPRRRPACPPPLMLDFFTDPFSQEFIRRAVLEVGLISIVGGALGCWVVFYGVSYAAESLAHALFPGLVIAALGGIPILVGGIPGIAVAALAIALVGRVPGIGRDTAVAVV